jgi:hydroxyacylglutathione hydrolase|tara:strand:+ start:828 stop:1589 length:762 start_codon:yes stop_codon:yes gene_type:complete
MEVSLIPCLTDNYAYVIKDQQSKTVGVVDPSESSPVIDFLKKKELKLDYILNTHHHFDHIGGNDDLKKIYGAKIVGFSGDKHRIPNIDIPLQNNSSWVFGKSKVRILHIPGHTLGHICFFFEKEKIAFTGDTLFSLGCGRIFEGTYEQMFSSINKIKKLPKATKIYCGHEYTFKNAKFCLEHDVENTNLKNKFKKIKELRSKNLPTIPTTLEDELKCNIFLRCDENELKAKLDMNKLKDSDVFKKIRDLKDRF